MKRREFIALLGSAAASADAALDPPLSARACSLRSLLCRTLGA